MTTPVPTLNRAADAAIAAKMVHYVHQQREIAERKLLDILLDREAYLQRFGEYHTLRRVAQQLQDLYNKEIR